MDQIASSTRTLRRLNQDTIEIVFYDHATLTVDNAIEDSKIYDEFTKKKRFKKLVILGLYTKSDIEARKQIALENRKRRTKIKAEAIVVKTPLIKVSVSIYQFFLKQNYPCRVFHSREQAMEWLKEF